MKLKRASETQEQLQDQRIIALKKKDRIKEKIEELKSREIKLPITLDLDDISNSISNSTGSIDGRSAKIGAYKDALELPLYADKDYREVFSRLLSEFKQSYSDAKIQHDMNIESKRVEVEQKRKALNDAKAEFEALENERSEYFGNIKRLLSYYCGKSHELSAISVDYVIEQIEHEIEEMNGTSEID